MPAVILPPATGCCCCDCGKSACADDTVSMPPMVALVELGDAFVTEADAFMAEDEIVEAADGAEPPPATVSESAVSGIAVCDDGGKTAAGRDDDSEEDAGIVDVLMGGVTGDVIAITPEVNTAPSATVGVTALVLCAGGTGEEVGVGGSSGNCKESSSIEQALP